MDKIQAPGGLPFVNAHDISACEDLLEAYFMQVGLCCREQHLPPQFLHAVCHAFPFLT